MDTDKFVLRLPAVIFQTINMFLLLAPFMYIGYVLLHLQVFKYSSQLLSSGIIILFAHSCVIDGVVSLSISMGIKGNKAREEFVRWLFLGFGSVTAFLGADLIVRAMLNDLASYEFLTDISGGEVAIFVISYSFFIMIGLLSFNALVLVPLAYKSGCNRCRVFGWTINLEQVTDKMEDKQEGMWNVESYVEWRQRSFELEVILTVAVNISMILTETVRSVKPDLFMTVIVGFCLIGLPIITSSILNKKAGYVKNTRSMPRTGSCVYGAI